MASIPTGGERTFKHIPMKIGEVKKADGELLVRSMTDCTNKVMVMETADLLDLSEQSTCMQNSGEVAVESSTSFATSLLEESTSQQVAVESSTGFVGALMASVAGGVVVCIFFALKDRNHGRA